MRTLLFLLAEFVLFGLGVISALGSVVSIVALWQIPNMPTAAAALMLLVLPVILFPLTYGFFKGSSAVDSRRRGRVVIRRVNRNPH